MSDISAGQLESLVTGDPEELDVHLALIERDVELDQHNVKSHCHCLAVDANGRVQPHRLAEFMRKAIVDYASVTDDGILKLYWGESKIYKNVNTAIRDCLSSLAPFLVEPEHEEAERERDLILLSDKADLSDPALTDALKRYFDKASPLSKRVQYCGIALVGFDASFYPTGKAIADEIAESARTELKAWKTKISVEDAEVLLAILQLHPDAKEKIGVGVTHFSVRSADFGSQCFWVNRIDGTTEKFSYRACFHG